MLPFCTPWKYQKTVGFSDAFKGYRKVYWEQMEISFPNNLEKPFI